MYSLNVITAAGSGLTINASNIEVQVGQIVRQDLQLKVRCIDYYGRSVRGGSAAEHGYCNNGDGCNESTTHTSLAAEWTRLLSAGGTYTRGCAAARPRVTPLLSGQRS